MAAHHYVKVNEEAIRNWVNDCQVCICLDRKRPKMPECTGREILMIINGLSKRYNFAKYTYREEMIGDAVLHVCKYINGFNSLKGSAFNFITFAAYHSFSNRIKIEHRQSYYKNKNLQIMSSQKGVTDQNGDYLDPGLHAMVNNSQTDFIAKVVSYEDKYKSKKAPKKTAAEKVDRTKGLFKFFEKKED